MNPPKPFKTIRSKTYEWVWTQPGEAKPEGFDLVKRCESRNEGVRWLCYKLVA